MAALTLALSAGTISCEGSASQFCAESDVPGGAPVRCVQISGLSSSNADVAASATMDLLCRAMGQASAPGECPADGRVGGCQKESEGYVVTEWLYEGTIDDINCGSSESKLDGDGTVLEAPAGDDDDATGDDDDAADLLCSLYGGADITVTFSNDSAQQVTLYWIDWDCNETAYTVLDAGSSHVQDTFGLHSWRARAGDQDPVGAVVWEQRLAESDDGSTLSIQ